MTYKALYRTYRPNTFEEVAGQKHIVQTLKNAVEQNKTAHAYLFCGPRGTGKTSIAKIFAKAMNCTGSGKPRPCMECENCLAITEGTHPDIVEIDAASNNGVEEVRNLIEKVKYAPIKGKYKIYIIDEVHMMSDGAFNALLKTIEEPPKHIIFILATTEPQKVLPTIISRCQRYDFMKVPTEDIILKLKSGLEKENIRCEDEVMRIIAQLCDGGMRDAWSIMDQCIAYAQNDIQVHHINEIYGILTVQEKLSLLEMVIDHNAGQCMNMVETFAQKGIDMKRLTMDLIELLKESIIYDYTKDSALLHILSSAEAEQLLNQINISHRYSMIDTLMETNEKYKNAANVQSYFEICLLKMMESPDVPISNVHHEKRSSQSINVSRETLIVKTQEKTEQSAVNNPVKTKIKQDIPAEAKTIEPVNDKPAQSDVMMEATTIRPLKDEFILRLLAGANKPEKQNDLESFQNIYDFALDLQWVKEANLLKHGKIFASGTTYVVFTVDSQAEANEINEQDCENKFLAFTTEIFHKQKKIFAITQKESHRITAIFKNKMADGTLPPPVEFNLATPMKKKSSEPTEEELVMDLFGKDNIMITED